MGIGGYKGHTKEAKLAGYKNNIKQIESASERYYMKKGVWPRASEEAYTSEQLVTYAERIRDLTGEEVVVDPDGKYYTIDYSSLSKYVQIPSDKENYILQNPLGRIYYLENLTVQGKELYESKKPIRDTAPLVVFKNPPVGSHIEIYSNDLGVLNKIMAHYAVEATEGKTEGKWYWEVTRIKTQDHQGVGVGVMSKLPEEKVINTFSDLIAISTIYYSSTNNDWDYPYNKMFVNGVESSLTYPIKPNDVISVLLDATNKEIQIKNNDRLVYKGSIVLSEGKELYPIINVYNANAVANFGTQEFTYAVPEGYKPYDYSNAHWFK